MKIKLSNVEIIDLIKKYAINKYPELENKNLKVTVSIGEFEGSGDSICYKASGYYEYETEYEVLGTKLVGKQLTNLTGEIIIGILKEIFEREGFKVDLSSYGRESITLEVEKENEKKLILGG
jgi:hypothetical protein